MFTFGVEIIPRAKLMEDVKTLGKGMVPRAGVEPARPFGQRILSPRRPLISPADILAVT